MIGWGYVTPRRASWGESMLRRVYKKYDIAGSSKRRRRKRGGKRLL